MEASDKSSPSQSVSQSIVVLKIEVTINPEHRDEFLELVQVILEPTRAQVGCLECHIFVSVGGADKFLFTERWESIALLKTHMLSRRFRPMLHAIDLSSESPKISIQDSSGYHDFESINEMYHSKFSDTLLKV